MAQKKDNTEILIREIRGLEGREGGLFTIGKRKDGSAKLNYQLSSRPKKNSVKYGGKKFRRVAGNPE